MTTRHDATKYCHNDFDHCLDRLRAALSTHLHALHEHGLGRDAEIVLVEWNPCSEANAASAFCDTRERGGRGFLSLAEAVEKLVVPSPSATAVRVLTVGADLHEKAVYNPTKKDIMEFIGKNVGARRARGEFILFTNPDNIFSSRLSSFLGNRHARSDTAYTAFKANVWLEVPVSSGTSPAAMSNFAQRTFHRPPGQLKTGRDTYRRAACPPASGGERGGEGGGLDGQGDDEDDEPLFTTSRHDLPRLFASAGVKYSMKNRME